MFINMLFLNISPNRDKYSKMYTEKYTAIGCLLSNNGLEALKLHLPSYNLQNISHLCLLRATGVLNSCVPDVFKHSLGELVLVTKS